MVVVGMAKTAHRVYTIWCNPVSHRSEMETPCWWKRSQENGQTSLSWQEGYGNSINHSLQTRWAEKHPRMYSVANLGYLESWMGTNSRKQHCFCSSQELELTWRFQCWPMTHWITPYCGQKFTEMAHLKIGKTSPGLFSVYNCYIFPHFQFSCEH